METRHSGKAIKAASSREKRRLDVANVVNERTSSRITSPKEM
jgi:hypothetical protein